MHASQRLIMLVEDSPEDAEMTIRSLQSAGLRNPIRHCDSGDDALEYLLGPRSPTIEEKTESPLPCLILLDLNLPGTDGRDVLRDIKQNERLKKIPVIVFTTSIDERDVETCYEMGANSYIQKPLDFKRFLEAMAKLKNYWFEVVVWPKETVHP